MDRAGHSPQAHPLLGGNVDNVMYKDLDGKDRAPERNRILCGTHAAISERQVVYEGKPLMLIFLGAAQDPNRADHPLWVRIREFLSDHPEFSSQYTFKLMAGYLDSQPDLWL